jgi:hypothetical protein
VKGTTAINLISGRKALLLINPGSLPDMNDFSYAFSNFWVRHGVKPIVISLDSLSPDICTGRALPGLYCRPHWRGNNILVTFNEKRIILLRDDRFYKFTSTQSLQADLLVITGNLSLLPGRITREIKPKMMILDGSVKKYKVKEWKKECEKTGISCYVIPEQGAFQLN